VKTVIMLGNLASLSAIVIMSLSKVRVIRVSLCSGVLEPSF
jgi:hypothetical protein